MPETREIIVNLPLLDEMARALREKGGYQRELSAQELAGIMSMIIANLVQKQDTVRASVPTMTVQIEKARGIVNGSVKVDSPIQAIIKVNCALDNDAAPGFIKLTGLNIQQEAGFAAKLALNAVNLEGKAREVFQNPNQALGMALSSQLEPRGVKLTGLGLHFNERTLAVNLKSEKVNKPTPR
jgi:hypothetical protein